MQNAVEDMRCVRACMAAAYYIFVLLLTILLFNSVRAAKRSEELQEEMMNAAYMNKTSQSLAGVSCVLCRVDLIFIVGSYDY